MNEESNDKQSSKRNAPPIQIPPYQSYKHTSNTSFMNATENNTMMNDSSF
jgi:hypothetical protein